MTGRTFSRDDWEAAQEAWTDGAFSDEWKPYRHQAAMQGMIYPPEGTSWDSWDDDEPSQRAMLIRAIRETPTLLHEAIAKSHSWGKVIGFILSRRDEWRDEIDAKDRDLARRKAEIEPDQKQAAMAVKQILTRIGDS